MQEAREPIVLYGDNYTAKDYLSWTFDATFDTLVYMQKAKWDQTENPQTQIMEDDYTESRLIDTAEAITMPIFYARIADILYQNPILLSIHAKDLLR